MTERPSDRATERRTFHSGAIGRDPSSSHRAPGGTSTSLPPPERHGQGRADPHLEGAYVMQEVSVYGSKWASWSKNDLGSRSGHKPNTRKKAAPKPVRTTSSLLRFIGSSFRMRHMDRPALAARPGPEPAIETAAPARLRRGSGATGLWPGCVDRRWEPRAVGRCVSVTARKRNPAPRYSSSAPRWRSLCCV